MGSFAASANVWPVGMPNSARRGAWPSPTAERRGPLLALSGISKQFGATQALRGVELSVDAGQVLALIGENGAGKSTLMKVISGAHPPDAGQMWLAGERYSPAGPHAARRAGVAMIYQELNLAPDLTVEENMMLGVEPRRWGLVRRRRQRERVLEALRTVGHPELDPRRRVGSLSIAAQQLIEIARGLVSDARVMIFDEPTSSLPRADVERLFAIIDRLREQGLGIIYISHFLEEVRQVANRFSVLRDGRSVGTGRLAEVNDSEIISLMVGRRLDTLFPKVPHEPLDGAGLQVAQLPAFDNGATITLTVRPGEILGLFGLIGAGRTELLRRIMGLDPAAMGVVHWDGQRLQGGTGRRRSAGLGLLSEDRKREGLAQDLSIADNLTLGHAAPVSRCGVLLPRRRQKLVRDWMQRLQVKAAGPDSPLSHLSGGNQQKVALARILYQDAGLLLLDEPTRGVDVRTKAEIYRLIGEQAAAGKAVVFVSSYLPELLAVCDSLGVMARGHLVDVRSVDDWTEAEVLAAAVSNPHPLHVET